MAAASGYPRLVADIGGTTARFAWVDGPGGEMVCPSLGPVEAHSGVGEAIEACVRSRGGVRPRACAIGVAAPVTGDRVALTNARWAFSRRELRDRLGCDRLLVLNDFEALVHGLGEHRPDVARQIGGGRADPAGVLVAVGPGTGLGVGALVRGGASRRAVAGEGGHATLAASDADEAELIAILRRRLGRVSAESVLSGPGLENLHLAWRVRAGHPAETLSAAEICARAVTGEDPACRGTLEQFFAFLGAFAGDLALTFGASGGVWIGGGIVARLHDALAASAFRRRFEDKGRRRGYVEAIATLVLHDPAAVAMRGANAALDA